MLDLESFNFRFICFLPLKTLYELAKSSAIKGTTSIYAVSIYERLISLIVSALAQSFQKIKLKGGEVYGRKSIFRQR